MNKQDIKFLLEDLHKNELSKIGKINLERYIIDLQNRIDEAIKYVNGNFYKSRTMLADEELIAILEGTK